MTLEEYLAGAHARLDKDPRDWALRLELAAVLESDAEDESAALAQSWMAAHGKFPMRVDMGTSFGGTYWVWGKASGYSRTASDYALVAPHLVPDDLHALLKDPSPKGWGVIHWRYHKTRQEAEANLAAALKASRATGGGAASTAPLTKATAQQLRPVMGVRWSSS